MCSSPGVPELKSSTLQHGGASVLVREETVKSSLSKSKDSL